MTRRSRSDFASTPADSTTEDAEVRLKPDSTTEDAEVRLKPDSTTTESTAVESGGVQTVSTQGQTFATFERLAVEASSGSLVDPSQRVILSRFAFLHAEAGTLVLETALSDVRATLVDPRSVTIVTMLASPASARDLADVTGCASDVASAFVGLLVRAGLATADGAGIGADEPAHASAWEFHDLLFHRRSRSSPLIRSSGRRVEPRAAILSDLIPEVGDHDTPRHGGTEKREQQRSVPRCLSVSGPSDGVPLPRDDDGASLTGKVSLASSLTRRQSVRTFGARPLTASTLGEFLFRSAGASGGQGHASGVSHRPYPSGGGCYPLEIYPLIVRCDNLAAGLYWYDAHAHRLYFRKPVAEDVEALIAGGVPDPGAPALPHVVLVIAARFERVQSTYEAVGYSLILKEVGALMQTMYLVAAAMDLAGCALGWGDAGLFARATGLPALVQGSVGEFALGTIDRRDGRTERS
jgi:SagB-type dehydrogenase family enzyme